MLTARHLLPLFFGAALGGLALAAWPVGSLDASDVRPGSDDPTPTRYSAAGYDITPMSDEEAERLAARLDPETYRITRQAGTEPAFCGDLLDNKKDGVYACVVCSLPLFSSEHKFTSGTGWPSFFQPVDASHVETKEDHSLLGIPRVEIVCARCDSHLGHVFDDGPAPTGDRHCVNSASLEFFEKGEERPVGGRPVETQVAYFAGGCFWGVEYQLERGPGVIDVVSGFMQGHVENPTYKETISTDTGHAETVKVVFDPNRVSYERLLEAFFVLHDPTQLNRQGPDVGAEYRSGVWFVDEAQERAVRSYVAKLTAEGSFDRPIVTQIEEAKTFYEAEAYHQDFVVRTGRPCHAKNPW